jgi:hypothetical protein
VPDFAQEVKIHQKMSVAFPRKTVKDKAIDVKRQTYHPFGG